MILNKKFHSARVHWKTFHCTPGSAIVLFSALLWFQTNPISQKARPTDFAVYSELGSNPNTKYDSNACCLNVLIRAMVEIFLFGERLICSIHSAISSLNGTINL